jgi:hypothetical protein
MTCDDAVRCFAARLHRQECRHGLEAIDEAPGKDVRRIVFVEVPEKPLSPRIIDFRIGTGDIEGLKYVSKLGRPVFPEMIAQVNLALAVGILKLGYRCAVEL